MFVTGIAVIVSMVVAVSMFVACTRCEEKYDEEFAQIGYQN